MQPLDYAHPRRSGEDRRQFSARTIYTSLFNPRRKAMRRKADKRNPMLDVYGWGHMLAAIALILFSMTDASFTLLLILQGGEELNPVMDYFLQMGTSEFFTAKMLMTFFSIFFFIACWNFLAFSFFRVKNFLFASLLIYTVLISYEITLLREAYPSFPSLTVENPAF